MTAYAKLFHICPPSGEDLHVCSLLRLCRCGCGMLWTRRLAVFLAALSRKQFTAEVDAGLFLRFLAIVNVVFNHLVLARLVLLAKGEEKLLGQLHGWRVVVMRVC